MSENEHEPQDSSARPNPPASVPVVVRETRSTWRPLLILFAVSGIFFLVFVVSSYLFFSKGLGGKSPTAQKAIFKKEGVALLEINGVIMDSKKALKSLKAFEENPNVKALVVRINSPGGAVAPSQEIYEAIRKFPHPKVASMSSVAASGGYYVAVANDEIYANPGTITGSIGVIMEFANLEKLYEWAKIKRFSIKTGKFKDSGAEYREMQPEEKALLQGMVDDVLVQFKTAVATGRKMTFDEVTPLADGRIFSGTQAKAAKLVDELGGIDEAIAAAGKLGGIEGKPRIIKEEKKHKGFLEFVQDQMRDDDDEDAEARTTNRVAAVLQRVLGLEVGLEKVRTILEPGIYWIWKGAL
ncbi:MAG: signal peptide peptidase SppA [Bdellovibrionales bacterium]|nr:signal peptide peptidase SppA [Bdellovibrionales bacterium]